MGHAGEELGLGKVRSFSLFLGCLQRLVSRFQRFGMVAQFLGPILDLFLETLEVRTLLAQSGVPLLQDRSNHSAMLDLEGVVSSPEMLETGFRLAKGGFLNTDLERENPGCLEPWEDTQHFLLHGFRR
jgi:hypothetical protein